MYMCSTDRSSDVSNTLHDHDTGDVNRITFVVLTVGITSNVNNAVLIGATIAIAIRGRVVTIVVATTITTVRNHHSDEKNKCYPEAAFNMAGRDY